MMAKFSASDSREQLDLCEDTRKRTYVYPHGGMNSVHQVMRYPDMRVLQAGSMSDEGDRKAVRPANRGQLCGM